LVRNTSGLKRLEQEVEENSTRIEAKAPMKELIDINTRMDEMPTRKEVRRIKGDIAETVESFKK